MSSRRVLKAAQAIREVVSLAIITDLKDPRIRNVTVTMVEVTPDLRQAKVNVTVMGDETQQRLCLRGLQNSAGFLQQKVGRRIDTRYTPRLEFVIDKGLNNALAVTKILEEVLPAERAEHGDNNSDTSAESLDDPSADNQHTEANEQTAIADIGQTEPTDVDQKS
jgi:ribosome-binding factor A